MSSAKTVAKELVRLSQHTPLAELLTYYRLQCLLYYGQAWSLVLRDSDLFPDDLKAADDGPVVPAILEAQGKRQGDIFVFAETFEREPDLDESDEAEFLRHLWMAYSYLSTIGLYSSMQQEPPLLKARKEREVHGPGIIDTNDLDASFSRRPGIPTPLDEYRRLRQEKEREAELSILSSPPLDVDTIWKNCRSVTPSASKR